METEPLVPFGKYKGQPITTLLNDTKYLDWCKQQEWFKKFPIVYNICVNQTIVNQNESSKTPEHNRIQNLFLEEENVKRLLGLKSFDKYNKCIQIIQDRMNCDDFHRYFEEYNIDNLTKKNIFMNIEFEGKFNWDIVIRLDSDEIVNFTFKEQYNNVDRKDLELFFVTVFPLHKNEYYINWYNGRKHAGLRRYSIFCSTTYIEVKPLLGDDYPCVLRKMKQQISLTEKLNDVGKYVLLVKDFSSSTTSKEQLIQIFQQSNIKVVYLNDVIENSNMQIQSYSSDNINELKDKIKKLEEENMMLKDKLKQYETSI
jgi:hypothetical protein